MITNEGTLHIKRYMAGWVPSIALSMAFGVGERPESATDEALQFEVGRSDIELTSYDFVQDKLVFKATLDEGFDATLYEVALYSLEGDAGAGEFGSRLITSFDSETEEWFQGSSPATYTTTNTRVGADSVTIPVAANGSISVSQTDTVLNLSGYSAADEFVFAFYCDNGNASSIRYRFASDATNYYDFTIPASSISTGFNIVRVTKNTAVPTGAPNWANITTVEVTVSAKNIGDVVVNLEGIRVEDMDSPSADYVMVARSILAIPFDKVAGRIQEVEFPLGVTVNGV